MQELVLILSSLAGVATAAAVRKVPRNKNQLLSLGASSHIKNQINNLKIEKDILTKTISRLYQNDSEFSKIKKDKLLLKYQHQLGIILAKIEKLEQASNHPDLGPVGDGLITLMDQKLSKLDNRLYEISSKMVNAKTQEAKVQEVEGKTNEKKKDASLFNDEKFNFENLNKSQKTDSVKNEPSYQKTTKSFELTTLTNISRKEPKFDEELKTKNIKQMPKPKQIQSEIIKPRKETIQEIKEPKPKVEDKIEIIQSIDSKQNLKIENKPDLNKQVAKITELKALPEPQKPKPTTSFEDNFDDDGDDLDKIKGDIMKVLSKLDQAEVE